MTAKDNDKPNILGFLPKNENSTNGSSQNKNTFSYFLIRPEHPLAGLVLPII